MTEKSKDTTRIVMDWKTGVLYGLRFNDEGDCVGAQRGSDGPIVMKPGAQPPMPPMGGQPPEEFPYGQTTYAFDATGEGDLDLFTIVWPEKEDSLAGKVPAVAIKTLPKDLVQAGIAAWPDALKSDDQKALENEKELKEALGQIMNLIGLDSVKNDLKQNIAMARFIRAKEKVADPKKKSAQVGPSLHLVFTGNPGTGKTTVAREYAKVLHALGFIKKPVVTEVSRGDLVAGFVGQTAIKTQEVIDKAMGGVLFIDEAYALTRSGSDKDFGKEAVDTLVAAMENNRDKLVVIVAGYPEPMKKFIAANEGLKSRFLNYLEFEDYKIDELSQIMDFMLEERGYTMSPDAKVKALEVIETEMSDNKESFGNGRTVRNLVDKAEKHLAFRLDKEGKLKDDSGLSTDELRDALGKIELSDVTEIDLSGISSSTEKKKGMGFSDEDSNKTSKPATNDNKTPPASSNDGQGETLHHKVSRPFNRFKP